MKCKECDFCRLGYFKDRPNDYVCIGVKYPFVIMDIDQKCTEYKDEESMVISNYTGDSYYKIMQLLNDVKYELKGKCDDSSKKCVKNIKDAICELGRLNVRLVYLESVCSSRCDEDDWWGD